MSLSDFMFPLRRPAPRAALASPIRMGRAWTARPNSTVRRSAFSAAAVLADAAATVAAAVLAGLAYQHGSDIAVVAVVPGIVVAVLFAGVSAARGDYAVARFLETKGHAERAAGAWVTAFGVALTIGFLTKTTATASRGSVVLLFVAGLGMVLLARRALARRVRARAEGGRVTFRTVQLIGTEAGVTAFLDRHRPERSGLRVVGASVLRDAGNSLGDDLALAVATARMLRPDDVFLLLPWGEGDAITRAVDACRQLPAAIHLGPAGFLDRFADVQVDRFGAVGSMRLVRSPLSSVEVAAKRVGDVVLAAGALVVLAPVLLAVALAIRLDGPGPVLFRQRRYGFNQEPFRILKFRTMTRMEDGADLRQATAGDARVTRVGRFLRRTSLDELPQLVNVLKGDMSLVGPRPHALAHDQRFERLVALYARRHNVRPGITGWAQVNGWRGETDTPEKIRGRVAHDLHYIDNWSMWLDLSILVRTVLSPRARRNAL